MSLVAGLKQVGLLTFLFPSRFVPFLVQHFVQSPQAEASGTSNEFTNALDAMAKNSRYSCDPDGNFGPSKMYLLVPKTDPSEQDSEDEDEEQEEKETNAGEGSRGVSVPGYGDACLTVPTDLIMAPPRKLPRSVVAETVRRASQTCV